MLSWPLAAACASTSCGTPSAHSAPTPSFITLRRSIIVMVCSCWLKSCVYRRLSLSENSAGIENSGRVERGLDRPHQLKLRRAARERQEVALAAADPMLCRHRAVEAGHVIVDHHLDLAL